MVQEYESEITLKKIQATYEMKKIEVESGEKNLFGKPVMTTKEVRTGNLLIKKEHLDMLFNTAREKEKLEQNVNQYLKADSIGMLNKIASYNVDLQKENDLLDKTLDNIIDEKSDLQRENTVLERQVNELKSEIDNVYKHVKSFLKEHMPNLSTFKQLFRGFAEEFKQRSPESEFNRIDQKEQKRERSKNRGMSR